MPNMRTAKAAMSRDELDDFLTDGYEEIAKRYREHEVFRRPLAHGDLGQIMVLKAWIRDNLHLEERVAAMSEGRAIRWQVGYSVAQWRSVVVEAFDEAEALEAAEAAVMVDVEDWGDPEPIGVAEGRPWGAAVAAIRLDSNLSLDLSSVI